MRLRNLVLANLMLLVANGAMADQLSVYAPIAPQYRIGDFEYTAPTVDGWRQVTSSTSGFVLVYAEVLSETEINTRAQVEAEAFAIPDPTVVRDTLWLTEQGQAQQVNERGEQLVAFSKIAPIGGNTAVFSYALVTRGGNEDYYETFYVTLAPDKTSYLVVKVTTKDTDFREQPYMTQLESSLASLRHVSNTATEGSGPDPAAETSDTE